MAGLVPCATSVREVEPVPDYAPDIRSVWAPAFPRADLVGLAAGQFPALPAWRGEEGPRWRIVISPGAIALESHDLARLERTYERQLESRCRVIDLKTSLAGEVSSAMKVREITGWSRRSRARMTRRLCELDYAPLVEAGQIPCMITLTYPGLWLEVAPDGKAVKKHVHAFLNRWERAWGHRPAGVWKLEFQERGAPHIHILTVIPGGLSPDGQGFRQWLSGAWAGVVAHPDPEQYRRHLLAGTGVDFGEGLRSRDPRRIGIYFTRYAGKGRQNEVPAQWKEPGKGPGRFWGVWGLERCTASVELAPSVADMASRTLRRWAHAQGITRQVTARRVDTSLGVVRYRTVRRRVRRLRNGHGWVSLNDAPAFALDLARLLAAPP